MRLLIIFPIILLLFSLTSCAQDIPNKEEQIAAALLTAPEDQREGATILGFDAKGNIVTLQEGTSNMICLADDPNKEGYNAACYHKDLEPFMTRGRELKAEGKGGGEIFNIREKEAKSGELKMPEKGATLHIRFGKEGVYNAETNTVDGTKLRYVVYIPFATSESTGLPTKPAVPGGPWIMDPGTHRAHIMISTPGE